MRFSPSIYGSVVSFNLVSVLVDSLTYDHMETESMAIIGISMYFIRMALCSWFSY